MPIAPKRDQRNLRTRTQPSAVFVLEIGYSGILYYEHYFIEHEYEDELVHSVACEQADGALTTTGGYLRQLPSVST
ncbi:MAG TPA: hypothetical protein DCF63_15330 [Planctomycetaceae bacterium]|nr:hypothetical protein [Planctomycetaceae bacterium]